GHGQADVAAAAIDVGADDTGNLIFEAVGLIADAHLAVELDALEVALQDEVGDAGNRVRAVSGRGAAGDDLDSLERGRRDGRHVDRAVGIARGAAAAVDQHQRTVGAHAAQRHRGSTGRTGGARLDTGAGGDRTTGAADAVEGGGGLGNHELRQPVQLLFDSRGARLLKEGFIDGDDRAVRLVILARDARAGDHDRAGLSGRGRNFRNADTPGIL